MKISEVTTNNCVAVAWANPEKALIIVKLFPEKAAEIAAVVPEKASEIAAMVPHNMILEIIKAVTSPTQQLDRTTAIKQALILED